MPTKYRFDLFDLSGNKQFVLTDFLYFSYTAVVNSPGLLVLQVRGDHPLLSSIEDKWQVEIWRKPEGQAWGREMVTLYRDIAWMYSDRSIAKLICPGIIHMLGWRHVHWVAGTNLRSAFVNDPSETVLKNLVDYNCGPNATIANGRKREGAIAGLSVQADGALGNTINWYCMGKHVLTELQEIALIAGGDFDLVKTSDTTWEFRWYTGQLGTDRTALVTFSMKFGNMGIPVYTENRIYEKTVAGVWGQGEAAERDFVERLGAGYSASNDIETFVDAREIDLGDTNGLNTKGDKRLVQDAATFDFTFETVQTPSSVYGVHYFLGDLATAINPYNDTEIVMKANRITIEMDEDGKEIIMPEFSTLL